MLPLLWDINQGIGPVVDAFGGYTYLTINHKTNISYTWQKEYLQQSANHLFTHKLLVQESNACFGAIWRVTQVSQNIPKQEDTYRHLSHCKKSVYSPVFRKAPRPAPLPLPPLPSPGSSRLFSFNGTSNSLQLHPVEKVDVIDVIFRKSTYVQLFSSVLL